MTRNHTHKVDMSSILKVGQTLQGRLSTYTLAKELFRSTDTGVVFLAKQVHSIPFLHRAMHLSCDIPRHKHTVDL